MNKLWQKHELLYQSGIYLYVMRYVITISILIDQTTCAHTGPLHALHWSDWKLHLFLNDRRLTHVLCQCAGHGIVQIDASIAVSMSNVSEIYTEKGNDMRRVRQRQKKIQRQTQIHVFVQFDVDSGGLGLYKQMKTRNRFECLQMVQIMARSTQSCLCKTERWKRAET